MRRQFRRATTHLLTSMCFVASAACATEGSAQSRSPALVRDDTAAVARLLRTVRGVDPLLCELVTRSVDMHGWWSRGGPIGDDPLEVDSASAALIAWIQRSHNDPAVIPRLGAAMRDSDACVRRVAGSFLGRVEHPSATAALVAALDDANADTRTVAAIGLGLSEKPAGVVTPLVRRLRDDSPLVRRSAAWALGSLEATGAMTALIDVLQRDADARVRQAAAWALGQIND
jgi:hypothetical protein